MPLFSQQPQAQSGQPISDLNATFVQGVGPGYWATKGTGLALNIAAGTCWTGSAYTPYAGGTVTLTASATNYVYVNTSTCAPAVSTSAPAYPGIATVVAGASSITSVTDTRTWFGAAGSGSGSVTSVSLTAPAFLSVTGSPITSSGTLALSLANQSANTVMAGPASGSAAAPTFRALGLSDLPSSLAQYTGTITAGDCAKWSSSGVLADQGAACGAGGGSVTLQTNGTNNASQSALDLVAGSNVTLTNTSAGNVTIAASLTGSGNAPTSWTVAPTSNSFLGEPAASQDASTLVLAPSLASNGTADIFDVCSQIALNVCSGTKYFGVGYNGNLYFSSNNLSLGSSQQSTSSYLGLYGGSGSAPYVKLYSAALSAPAFGNSNVGQTGSSGVAAGTYNFTVTFTAGAGGTYETTASSVGSITLSGAADITIVLPSQVSGNYGLKVYDNSNSTLCGSLVYPSTWTSSSCTATISGSTITITAIAASPAGTAPTQNTTGAINSSFLTDATGYSGVVCAQSTNPGQDCATGSWIPTQQTITPTTGNCAKWTSFNQLGDSGAPCGSGGGSSAWSSLTAASASLSLNNGAFSTTFNQSLSSIWLWANTTAATSGTSQNSPFLQLSGQYWNGTASAADTWSLDDALGTGTNGPSTLVVGHAGTSGLGSIDFFDDTSHGGDVIFNNCGTSACNAIEELDSGGTARFDVSGSGAISAVSATLGGNNVPSIAYATSTSETAASTPVLTMVTPSANHLYRFSLTILQTAVASSTGCTLSTYTSWTDAVSGLAVTNLQIPEIFDITRVSGPYTTVALTSTSGNLPLAAQMQPEIIDAKASDPVTYSAAYAGSCGSPVYTVQPVLEQLQ